MPATSTTQVGQGNPLSPLDQASRDLLRAITRRSDQNNARQVEGLARGVQDWDTFLEVAREHRLLPLAFSRLIEVPGTVPPAVMERLKAAYHRNVFHSVANAAELIAILKAVDLAQIPAMPFKGIVLGSTIYPELAARHAGDIDILIDLENLRRATAILLNMGYDLKTPVREDGSPALLHSYEYHFERPADGMVVELRWRLELTQPRYRRDIGLQWVWPTRQTTRLAGVDIPNMAPETTLLVLCMHGSKHVWSRLIWICDVAFLLDKFSTLDWKRVTQEARRLGLWRALALGVLLAQRVCSADVPQATLQPFEADDTVVGLARSIEENLFDKPGELPKNRIPYNIKLLGLKDRLRLLFSLDFFRPNERDLNFVRLPKPLHAFYFLVRPLRMMWDKSAR